MRLLLTNDDGIDSVGLHVLARAMREFGEVVIVAPDAEYSGASSGPSSLARQWRKAKRSIKTTKRIGEQAIAEGHATKIFTKRLRKRFQPVGARNFSKYARRAADEFGSKKIVRQVVKLERMVDQAIRDMEK